MVQYFKSQNLILADFDTELAKIAMGNTSLNLVTAVENDKRYLICANWWREWCDYANFDLSRLHNNTRNNNLMAKDSTELSKQSKVHHQESTILENDHFRQYKEGLPKVDEEASIDLF